MAVAHASMLPVCPKKPQERNLFMGKQALLYTILIAILLIIFLLPLEDSIPSPLQPSDSISFYQTYGGPANEKAYTSIQTSDGGYALTGYTWVRSQTDIWLVKTDNKGVMLWNRTYGDILDGEKAYAILETEDGGFIITGSSGHSFGDIFLLKTDDKGNLQWLNTYGKEGSGSERAQDLIESKDGGYVLVGQTSTQLSDVWLIKTNANGHLIWEQTYGGFQSDIGYALLETSDQELVITGSTASFGMGMTDMWLLKTDSLGNLKWNRTYGNLNYDAAFSLIADDKGGYILVGYTESTAEARDKDIWLVKTDEKGEMIWSQEYGDENVDEVAFALIQTKDGGYAFVGRQQFTDLDANLVKTDSSGVVEFTFTYGGTANDEASALVQTADEGFVLGGFSCSFGGGEADMWLLKTNAKGHSVLDNRKIKNILSNTFATDITAKLPISLILANFSLLLIYSVLYFKKIVGPNVNKTKYSTQF